MSLFREQLPLLQSPHLADPVSVPECILGYWWLCRTKVLTLSLSLSLIVSHSRCSIRSSHTPKPELIDPTAGPVEVKDHVPSGRSISCHRGGLLIEHVSQKVTDPRCSDCLSTCLSVTYPLCYVTCWGALFSNVSCLYYLCLSVTEY